MHYLVSLSCGEEPTLEQIQFQFSTRKLLVCLSLSVCLSLQLLPVLLCVHLIKCLMFLPSKILVDINHLGPPLCLQDHIIKFQFNSIYEIY